LTTVKSVVLLLHMSKENAMAEAQWIASNKRIKMAVVHAPIEHAEDEDGYYGYCPLSGVGILYSFAMKGMGQKDCPAQGIVAEY
jgi:hypothetical protein